MVEKQGNHLFSLVAKFSIYDAFYISGVEGDNSCCKSTPFALMGGKSCSLQVIDITSFLCLEHLTKTFFCGKICLSKIYCLVLR